MFPVHLLVLLLFRLWICKASEEPSVLSKKPNIIIILADDLGWNDVSFHGANQIPTPNIDALAYNGLILNNHYVPALCSPSRAALLTGKHPIHTGMQHLVILENEPRGLSLNERLMPEYLRDEGYVTRAIGKWHLGFYRREYLPTNRGFDSHFGYWNGFHDYFNHETSATFDASMRGYDLHRNEKVAWEAQNNYSTRLFTQEAVSVIRSHDKRHPLFMYLAHLAPHTGNTDKPFQAPQETIDRFGHIGDPERRSYAAMVAELDDSVGEVIQALRKRSMLDSSIILFMSDNGAPTYGIHSNRGSNWPLRGIKQTPWEGGVRGVAALWVPWLNTTRRVTTQNMHIMDWLPTLFSAAGLDLGALKEHNLDGVDMWPALSGNLTSPRIEVLHNLDEIDQYASLTRGDWKYITGTTQAGTKDTWFGETGRGYSDPFYNISNVLHSKAGSALASVSAPRERLTPSDVLALRDEAEVRCGERPKDDLYQCDPLVAPCLFNIREDPCELVDLSSVRPLVAMSLAQSVERWRRSALPAANVQLEEVANPKYYNNTWVPWQDQKLPKLLIHAQPDIITLAAVLGSLAVGVIVVVSILIKLFCKKNISNKVAEGN